MPHSETATPASFPVSVILEKRPSTSRWANHYWTATGVLAGAQTLSNPTTNSTNNISVLQENGQTVQYLYAGFSLHLYRDQCESYYHNMRSPKPSCYVIARLADDGTPTPFLVTLSFDEAHAYLEGDDEVYAVPIPPELYVWSERFMLDHYFPEQRKKRKRTDWHDGNSRIKS